jgi:glycosyltransferase involved in cell wall biosynthesis
LNILLLCFEYPPIGGGGGVGAQQYAEAWVSAGHQVTVLTSRARGLSRREVVDGVDIIRVYTVEREHRATASVLSMFCYNVTALTHYLLHFREFKTFHVINTHFSIPTGPVAAVIAKLCGCPNVLTIIGGDIYDPSKKSSPHRNPILRVINRWIMNSADRVVAISSDTRRRAEKYYKVRRSIEVINYGFTPAKDRSCSVAETLEPGKFYLISIGRLVRRKGFEYLIQAMKSLPKDIALLLIGDGPLEFELKSLAVSECVAERVRMLGFQTREQIHVYLRQADCFVLPSLHEGLGIVVQEAMHAGLPVVVTDNGGQVDLIKYPRNGILVATGSVDALTEGINRLYTDRALAASMGKNNQIDVQDFHIEKNCQRYLEMFQAVMKPSAWEKSIEVA